MRRSQEGGESGGLGKLRAEWESFWWKLGWL